MSLVVFPFKREDKRVIAANIAVAARHDRVGEVWAVAADDGDEMREVAEIAADIASTESIPIEVFAQRRIGVLRSGKGDGLNTALERAAERAFDRVHFYDADITNFDHTWIEGAERAVDRGYGVVRHRFPRASTDAMITWMITKPSLAMFFPGTILPRIGQPLGGELLITRETVESLASDPFVRARSDWGIDTIITHATSTFGVPMYEHYVGDGKRHALYGSLDEIRTMALECLDAAISLKEKASPNPASPFGVDPATPVPLDLKSTKAYEVNPSISLLTSPWQEDVVELAGRLPEPLSSQVLENRQRPNFEFMTAAAWGETLHFLHDEFRLGHVGWETLAFRLWLMRVLAYTTTEVPNGYDPALRYLDQTIHDYETGVGQHRGL